MSPATLVAPPELDDLPSSDPSQAAPPRLPVRAPLRAGRGRVEGLRITRGGIALSLAIHAVLAVLLVVGIDQAVRRNAARTAATQTREAVSYMDVSQWPPSAPGGTVAAPAPGSAAAAARSVTAAAIDSAIARTSDLRHFPERIPTRLPSAPAAGRAAPAPSPAPSAAPPAASNGAGAADANAISGDAAAGPFGPGYRDRRLIVTPQAVPERTRTDHERYMEHLTAVLNGMSDSAAAEAEHQRRLHNWTWKDSHGREWGLGEGGVPIVAGHKLPTRLEPPIYQGRENAEAERTRNRQHADIERQADDTERDRNFRERAQATRRHADEERNKRRSAPADSAQSTSP